MGTFFGFTGTPVISGPWAPIPYATIESILEARNATIPSTSGYFISRQFLPAAEVYSLRRSIAIAVSAIPGALRGKRRGARRCRRKAQGGGRKDSGRRPVLRHHVRALGDHRDVRIAAALHAGAYGLGHRVHPVHAGKAHGFCIEAFAV